jgi:hypothetical protein
MNSLELAHGPTQRQAFVATMTSTTETNGFFQTMDSADVTPCSPLGGYQGRDKLPPSSGSK